LSEVKRTRYAVRDIGDGVAVRVNLEFIDRFGREGFFRRGPGWVYTGGWMHVHNQDRFANIPGLGECIQVSKIEAGIPMGKAIVGTGVMV
jgi:hypothetical protein